MNNTLPIDEFSSIQMTKFNSSTKFKEGVYSCFNITKISDDSITIYNPHRNSIDLPLYHNDDGYYFFLDRNYISRGSAFDDILNNIYGLFLKEVNTWIICDFPLYSISCGIEPYLDLYYKHNPVKEIVQGEIVENPQDIHNRICDNFDKVEKTLYEICVDLKTIRDNKYYISLGYDNFEHYCKVCFNIGRSYASQYCSIAENLSRYFVCTCKQIGVRKLYILSRLTNNERTELLESTDIEHTPVKQLEQKAKEIKNNREVKQPIFESDDISLTSDVVSPVPIPQNQEDIVSKIDDTSINFKYFCENVHYSGSRGLSAIDSTFTCYDGQDIKHNLLDYYSYFTKTLNKLLKCDNIDILDCTIVLDKLSDLIEVSKRFGDTLYDVKQSLKREIDNKKSASDKYNEFLKSIGR